MTIQYGRWQKYYGKRNGKLEVVFVFYLGGCGKQLNYLTQDE